MTTDLKDQVRTFTEYFLASIDPVDLSELVDQVPPVRVARPLARRRRPRWAYGLATALAIVLVLGGTALAIWLFAGNSETEFVDQPTTTMTTPPEDVVSEPGTVFSWDGDDLGEWVTEDEITGALEDVVGADFETGAVWDPEADDWVWTVGGWTVTAHNGDHSPGGGVVDPTQTDPRLPQGVFYEASVYGHYILSGPASGESICMSLSPPNESPSSYLRGSVRREAHKTKVFALASMMLQEMGWVDPQDTMSPPTAGRVDSEDTVSLPITGSTQTLFGDGDIGCPNHWTDDQSLPVGSVDFEAGASKFTVVVELTAAAPGMQYRVEIWEPDTCQTTSAPFVEPGQKVFATDETGAGRLEFVVGDVAPGTYRLNVNVVQNDLEDNWPETEDIRLREIGGAGFSLVEVP